MKQEKNQKNDHIISYEDIQNYRYEMLIQKRKKERREKIKNMYR